MPAASGTRQWLLPVWLIFKALQDRLCGTAASSLESPEGDIPGYFRRSHEMCKSASTPRKNTLEIIPCGLHLMESPSSLRPKSVTTYRFYLQPLTLFRRG